MIDVAQRSLVKLDLVAKDSKPVYGFVQRMDTNRVSVLQCDNYKTVAYLYGQPPADSTLDDKFVKNVSFIQDDDVIREQTAILQQAWVDLKISAACDTIMSTLNRIATGGETPFEIDDVMDQFFAKFDNNLLSDQ